MPATKKRGTSAKKRSGGRQSAAPYVRLRTALDALEMAAIRYYAEGRSAADRLRREEEVERLLSPVIMELMPPGGSRITALGLDDGGDSEGGCPDGYVRCNGVCVPYPCPD